VLETLPLLENSDDFVFDNQMLAQTIFFGFSIGEASCPTRYFPEASSINLPRSIKYGLGVLYTSGQFLGNKIGLIKSSIFLSEGRKIASGSTKTAESRSDREKQTPIETMAK
jgi:hypothetical protein